MYNIEFIARVTKPSYTNFINIKVEKIRLGINILTNN